MKKPAFFPKNVWLKLLYEIHNQILYREIIVLERQLWHASYGTHILLGEADALVQSWEEGEESVGCDREGRRAQSGTDPVQLSEVGQLGADALCQVHQFCLHNSGDVNSEKIMFLKPQLQTIKK